MDLPSLARKVLENDVASLASSRCFLLLDRRRKLGQLHTENSVFSTAATTFGAYSPSFIR